MSDVTKSLERLRELDAQFDRQLESFSESDSRTASPPSSQKPFSLKRWVGRLFFTLVLLVLPFIILIRVSIYSYLQFGLNGWLALGAGIAVTILLLTGYALFISQKLTGKIRVHRYIIRGIIGLVLIYCCYGLQYLSGMNAKTEEIRYYYRSLHPILRITMLTATAADADLVITDIQRTPDDYQKMGLTPLEQSFHYEQPTGFVHAVDLRTIGRAEWKNRLTRLALNVLGFKTLRHSGTADHLHVALPLNE